MWFDAETLNRMWLDAASLAAAEMEAFIPTASSRDRILLVIKK
jgi:hypothetical protein